MAVALADQNDDGDMLLLWVRLSEKDLVVDIVYEDDIEDDSDEELGF